MDYVNPKDLIQDVVLAAHRKVSLGIVDMLLRGALSGVFLGFATSLAIIVTTQGLPAIVGALLFPAGFVILVLLGLELATGNFALLPVGVAAGEISLTRLLRNWGWVYLGNLIGCVFYALLFYWATTNLGSSAGGPAGDLLKTAAEKKTLGYMMLGACGWTTAFVKGILCNWMVTIGALLALVSRSTIGKIVAMWIPILTFFAQGFEHSVVNMFVIPAGMMFGASVSIRTWLFWNQLPVTLGNIVSGALFTGLALYATYHEKQSCPSAAEPALTSTEATVSFSSAAD